MKNPIDKAQRERLLGAKRKLAEVVDLLQRCQRCGINVDEREQVAALLFDRLGAVETEFMGTRRAGVNDADTR